MCQTEFVRFAHEHAHLVIYLGKRCGKRLDALEMLQSLFFPAHVLQHQGDPVMDQGRGRIHRKSALEHSQGILESALLEIDGTETAQNERASSLLPGGLFQERHGLLNIAFPKVESPEAIERHCIPLLSISQETIGNHAGVAVLRGQRRLHIREITHVVDIDGLGIFGLLPADHFFQVLTRSVSRGWVDR